MFFFGEIIVGANISGMSGKFRCGDDSFISPSVGGRVKESDAPSRQALANSAPNTRPLPQNEEKVTSSSAHQGYAASSSHSTVRWKIDEKYRQTHSRGSLSDVQQTGAKDTTAKPRFLAGAPWIESGTWKELYFENSENESNINQRAKIQDPKLRHLVKQVKNGNLAVPIAAHTLLAGAAERDMPQTLSVYQEFDSLLSDKASDKNPPILHLYNVVRRMAGGYSYRLGGHSNWKFCLSEEKDYKYFGPAKNIPEQFWDAINDPAPHKLNAAGVICEIYSKTLYPIFDEQSQKLISKLPNERSDAFDLLNATLWHNSYPGKKSKAIKNPQAFIAESYNAMSLALGCIRTHISILNRQIEQRRDLLTAEDRHQIQMTDIAYINACEVMDGAYLSLKKKTMFNKIPQLQILNASNGRLAPENESTSNASDMPDTGGRMVVVSNRVINPDKPAAGGLAIALGDVMRKTAALWFGSSSETNGEPGSNSIKTQLFGKTTLATVDLTEQQHKNYYEGFSNSLLWPILHGEVGLAEKSNPEYFEGYVEVNKMFAAQLAPLLKDDDVLWIHDYHLIPLAQELRALGCKQPMGFFNHIPMPSPDVFREIPQHKELMEALFWNDLIGMQTTKDVENLRRYVETEGVGRRLDSPFVEAFGRKASVRSFPIGIDVEKFEERMACPSSPDLNEQAILNEIHDESGKRKLILGVDRLDYTKGIPTRLEAFRKLLADHPELQETVTFVQIAAPSREGVLAYNELSRTTSELVREINEEFGTDTWKPVLYFNKSVSHDSLPKLFRQSQVGVVTPVADGMNLVAKEYIASQDPKDPGVLVLSTGAGAASQLRESVLVPPKDFIALAEAYQIGLGMELEERQERHVPLLNNVRNENLPRWRENYMADLRSVQSSSASGVQRAVTEEALPQAAPLGIAPHLKRTLEESE